MFCIYVYFTGVGVLRAPECVSLGELTWAQLCSAFYPSCSSQSVNKTPWVEGGTLSDRDYTEGFQLATLPLQQLLVQHLPGLAWLCYPLGPPWA